ncbi:thioredoxin-like [Cottoperca gobio]|uniref:Thioredoxin-like n=1 Tax=Cottoperca gobio TaxID=56716 RepID=A0A6J2RLB3_COTGO|nr:thioredoxin-like [Cottoperca gobio]
MGVIEINNWKELKAALKDAGDKLVVVDFTATWCEPCRQISPVFHAQSTNAENVNVVFLTVDVDKASDASEKSKVNSMPTFHFYKNGKKVAEFSGSDKDALLEKLKSLRT